MLKEHVRFALNLLNDTSNHCVLLVQILFGEKSHEFCHRNNIVLNSFGCMVVFSLWQIQFVPFNLLFFVMGLLSPFAHERTFKKCFIFCPFLANRRLFSRFAKKNLFCIFYNLYSVLRCYTPTTHPPPSSRRLFLPINFHLFSLSLSSSPQFLFIATSAPPYLSQAHHIAYTNIECAMWTPVFISVCHTEYSRALQ